MCGIAGILYRDPQQRPDPAVLKAMGDSLAHRGPDAEGFFSQPGIGLVHRRLSIIDLAGGDQPMGNEDDSIQVVFNGEIYNYRQLHPGWKSKATASAPGPTPRSWFTSTRKKARTSSRGCGGCSPWPSGMGPGGG